MDEVGDCIRIKVLTPGSMVSVTGQVPRLGIVVAMVQANHVPDAVVRGLMGMQPWSYWVLLSGSTSLVGPLDRHMISDMT